MFPYASSNDLKVYEIKFKTEIGCKYGHSAVFIDSKVHDPEHIGQEVATSTQVFTFVAFIIVKHELSQLVDA